MGLSESPVGSFLAVPPLRPLQKGVSCEIQQDRCEGGMISPASVYYASSLPVFFLVFFSQSPTHQPTLRQPVDGDVSPDNQKPTPLLDSGSVAEAFYWSYFKKYYIDFLFVFEKPHHHGRQNRSQTGWNLSEVWLRRFQN